VGSVASVYIPTPTGTGFGVGEDMGAGAGRGAGTATPDLSCDQREAPRPRLSHLRSAKKLRMRRDELLDVDLDRERRYLK
jgi:hypothetical protein